MKNIRNFLFFCFILILCCCVDLPCIHEKASLTNKNHTSVNVGATIKDPPAIFVKRCHEHGCHSRKVHCHGNSKFRGSPWWKKQNPETDEDVKFLHDSNQHLNHEIKHDNKHEIKHEMK